jgi:hypothetical protein
MSRLPAPLDRLPFPVIGAPLFIISNPRLVIAQCIAAVVGSMPALNARPPEQLEEWLLEITQALAAYNLANPQAPAAPFAINQIVHKSNGRLEHDMGLCVKYKVPIIITSLGAREDVNAAVHSYDGVVLHDVIHNKHAHKAIEKGADGLIAVATGLLSTTSAMASHATAESLLIFVCLSKFAQALADTMGWTQKQFTLAEQTWFSRIYHARHFQHSEPIDRPYHCGSARQKAMARAVQRTDHCTR